MIKRTSFYTSDCSNPYTNLAREKYLLDTVDEDTCILYLWQNQNTVVIGKNQNAFAECRAELLEKEGGRLARRLSGGGAVFHDLGNLNFTFLSSANNMDVQRNMRVISKACAIAGIETEISGRNDILADGRKFSGNAFYNSGARSYHHGTILISTDTEKMQKYLTPPKAKLISKGVKSVKSRVLNLRELVPDLTCEKMKDCLLTAFGEVYGLTPSPYGEIANENIAENEKKYSSWEYIYGSPLAFDVSASGRCSFGNAELQISSRDGFIKEARLYTDAIDLNVSQKLSSALDGCKFDQESIKSALYKELGKDFSEDVISLINEQIFT